jgi:hypothetical protein
MKAIIQNHGWSSMWVVFVSGKRVTKNLDFASIYHFETTVADANNCIADFGPVWTFSKPIVCRGTFEKTQIAIRRIQG